MWLFKRKREVKKIEPVRGRLMLLQYIKTDRAEYLVYRTKTLPDDHVNIEIERVVGEKRELLLENEIFEESFSAMGGVSFSGLVLDALRRLHELIRERKEFVVENSKILREL